MFSSVDAENARFVKVYLQTSSGEVPLEVPASFRKEVAVLKAAPNQASANHLALRLANEAWSDASGVWLQRAAAVKKSPTYGIIDAAILHLPPEPQRVVPAAFGSLSQWEPASKSTAAAAIEFQEVRVEVWRYRYERAAQCLQSELLFTSHEPRPEKQP